LQYRIRKHELERETYAPEIDPGAYGHPDGH
jgi:hypothetical protein